MKINPVLLIIALAIAGLSAFGFYQANAGETYRVLVTAGAGLTLFVTLGGLLALSSSDGGVNIKIVSALFFIASLAEHIIFSVAGAGLTPYVIVTGILLLLYVLICYAVTRALR